MKASHTARRLVLWSVTGIAAQGLSRLSTNVLIGRVAGVESLGHVSTISAAAFGAALLGPTAIAAAQTKFVAHMEGRGEIDSARAMAQTLSSWSFLSGAILSVVVGLWLGVPLGVSDALVGLCLTLGACGYAMGRSVCFLEGRNEAGARWEVLMGVFGLTGAGIMAWLGAEGGLLLIPQALALNAYAAHFNRPKRRVRALPREIVEFVFLSTVAGLASAGVFHLTILAARLDGDSLAAGLASAALAVSTPLSFIAGAVTSVLYPRLARSVGAQDIAAGLALARRAALGLASVLLPPVFLATYFAPDFLSAVWGKPFTAAAELVAPMAAGIVATAVAAPEVAMLTASSRSGVRQSTVASIGGTAIGIVLWVMALWMPGSQLTLISYGYMVSMSLTAIASTVILARRIAATTLYAAGACAVILAAPVARGLTPSEYEAAVGVAAGGALLAASLWAVRGRAAKGSTLYSLVRR